MKIRLLPFFLLIMFAANAQPGKVDHWFPRYDIELASFKKPALSFGPMARWWWPGNDVTTEELQREINLFADNGFAGVEVQPLVIGIPMFGDAKSKVLSWDTPAYYGHLKTVMEAARKRGLIVDVTNGSGWPPGGSFLQPEDGFLSLEYGAVTIDGGKTVVVPLPKAINKTTVPSKLQAVVAARIVTGADSAKTELLDGASAKILTQYARRDTLRFTFPKGTWKLIAFWAIPSGEQTMIAASPKQGPVIDHFDSLKVLKSYDHLFGERTGLKPYFGNPMRAVFNDSYEFKANRHYSPDLITYFKKKRGYDITPWLPANMQKGYNFVEYMRPHTKPDFSFGNEDWRLRYDYDITLGELLGEHFFKTSKSFFEQQGLLHRTQAYGLNMDMIAMAGMAGIPETESMLGTEANLKIMTSGGHLYNRPLISAETGVFINRAYTVTPQIMKAAVDKLFAAGVNQVIYHGIPYRYTPERLGPEGWYPFSTPFIGGINFSTNLGEGNIFWKYQQQINAYVNRMQYVLRSGNPHSDVLIYFPFLNVEQMPDNPEEILTTGSLEHAAMNEKPGAKTTWAAKVYPFINQLEANGITWEWVNDASLQQATLAADGSINIRGNRYQALILANDSMIQLNTAAQINKLAHKGMKLLATGTLPYKQPSFLNWKENDRKTAQYIAASFKTPISRYVSNDTSLSYWIKRLHQAVKFAQPYSFIRQSERIMSDGSRIRFIWNKSNEWQTITANLDKKFSSCYWLNAEDGAIVQHATSTAAWVLPPYGSVVLYASTKSSAEKGLLSAPPVQPDRTRKITTITQWDIKTDSIEIKSSPLFDWRTNNLLKFSAGEGIYTASFQWQPENTNTHYFLDLGKVYYAADVYINEQYAGRCIAAPYMTDITSFLKEGKNQVNIRVTPGQLNGYIGNANKGDKRYAQFKGKENQLLPAGLLGPVVIRPGLLSFPSPVRP